jgi:ornithine cyclodeaminase
MCEIPAASLARALLVVESVEATLAEAGDVVRAIDSGALPTSGFAHELHELLNGVVGRQDEAQITVFKSVGLAVEDLIVARAAADVLADVDALAGP